MYECGYICMCSIAEGWYDMYIVGDYVNMNKHVHIYVFMAMQNLFGE